MRTGLILAPLLLCAAPAFAQPAPKVQPIAVDPAVTNRLVDVAQSLAQAMLSTPVGDIEAAVQGRKPTAADRGKTVASEAGVNERDLRASIDAALTFAERGAADIFATWSP